MSVQWINEPCPGPGGIPPGMSVAQAYFGSGVMPVTTRPPWLRDSGGVAPGIIAGEPDDGALGQPYAGETWQFRFYGADGYLIFAMPGYRVLTYAQGVETLRQAYLNSSAARGVAKVCAVARSQYGGARLCYTSYGLRTETNSPTWAGTRGCRPGAALRADGWCVFKVPMQPLSGPYGFVGQACEEIQSTINTLEKQRSTFQAMINDFNVAIANAQAAGDNEGATVLAAQKDDAQGAINNINAQISQLQQSYQQCLQGQATIPACGSDNDCAAGFICANGNCISGCRNDGDCGAGAGSKCIKANPTDEFGQCGEPPPPPPAVKRAGMGGGWALALLGLAAVAAIFMRGGPGGPAEEMV